MIILILTLNERKIIQTGIENRSTKVSIANTIAKEIEKHRLLHPKNSTNYPNICIHLKENCFSTTKSPADPHISAVERIISTIVPNVLFLFKTRFFLDILLKTFISYTY